MFCSNCGSALKFEHLFCAQCGKRAVEPIRPAHAPPQFEPQSPLKPQQHFDQGPSRTGLNPVQISKSGSFRGIPHAAFLGLGIIQVLGILIFLFKALTQYFDFYFIPFAIGDLLLVSIIVVAGFSNKTSRNPALLVAAAIVGFLQFARAAPNILEVGLDLRSFRSVSGFLPSSILAATGIFVIPLVVLQLQPGSWIIRPPKGWWRVAIGPLAVVFLLIEDPRRVLSEEWIFLSVALLLVMAASGLFVNRVAVGAYLGLGIAIASSLFSWIGNWASRGFSDSWWAELSAISIPSLIALILMILGVISTAKYSLSSVQVNSNQGEKT